VPSCVAAGLLQEHAGVLRGGVLGVDREVPRGRRRSPDVGLVLFDIEFEFLGFEQHAVGEDGAQVEAHFLGSIPEFAQDVREVGRDLLTSLEDRRVLHDLDRTLVDARVGTDALGVRRRTGRIDAGVTLGDDDVVRRDLACVDRRGRSRPRARNSPKGLSSVPMRPTWPETYSGRLAQVRVGPSRARFRSVLRETRSSAEP